MEDNEQIVQDPAIIGGVPVIRGTRVPVYVILESMESGCSQEDILRDYPSLTPEKIRAAIHFAAELCGTG